MGFGRYMLEWGPAKAGLPWACLHFLPCLGIVCVMCVCLLLICLLCLFLVCVMCLFLICLPCRFFGLRCVGSRGQYQCCNAQGKTITIICNALSVGLDLIRTALLGWNVTGGLGKNVWINCNHMIHDNCRPSMALIYIPNMYKHNAYV